MKRTMISIALSSLVLGGCATMPDSQNVAANDPFEAAIISSKKSASVDHSWTPKMEEQKKQLETVASGSGIQVSQTPNNRLQLAIPVDNTFSRFRSQIKSDIQPELDKIASSMMQNPNTQITIIGHTDKLGSDAVNYPLSVKHASTTRDYLISKGVPSHRIKAEGRGSFEPIASNDTSANRAQNRRIEIFVSEHSTMALNN